MLRSATPPSFPIAFASSASGSFIRAIPTASQIGIQSGAASLTDGFPPLTFNPVAAGGVPPFGADFNGLLNQITLWNQWQEAGAPIIYNATFQTAIGGYPQGAIVQSAIVPGKQWMSTVDSNMTNPDALGANWSTPAGQLPSGTPIASFSSTTLPSCVQAAGGTIGNVGSGGTTGPTSLTSATAFFLFCAIWQQFSQAACPTQFNGATVARGANAQADWTAGRVIATPNMAGCSVIGVDGGTGRLNNGFTPVAIGSTTAVGSLVGENTHILSLTELANHAHNSSLSDPTHAHSYTASNGGNALASSFPGGISNSSTTGNSGTGISLSNATAGGNGAHNNVDLNWTVIWNLAL